MRSNEPQLGWRQTRDVVCELVAREECGFAISTMSTGSCRPRRRQALACRGWLSSRYCVIRTRQSASSQAMRRRMTHVDHRLQPAAEQIVAAATRLSRCHHASPTSPRGQRNHIAPASGSPYVRGWAKSQAFDVDPPGTLRKPILAAPKKPQFPAAERVIHGRRAIRWPKSSSAGRLDSSSPLDMAMPNIQPLSWRCRL
jgi:hypothetical protein